MASEAWRHDKRKTSERGYGWRWQQARAAFLARPENVLCVMCKISIPPRITEATVVDHKIPHRGDQKLFWDRTNWQSLCKAHHDSDKQALEKSGRVQARIGLDGFPIE